MGDDWDDDEWEAPDLSAGKEAPESWSDEEGHDAHKQEAPAPVAAPKKPEKPKEKTLLELKIEEREAREAAEAEAKAKLRADAGMPAAGELEDVDDKQRRREQEEAAAFDDALDAFGVVEAPKPPPPKPPPASREAKLPAADGFVATSDADFETLARMMYSQLQPYEGKKGFSVALKAFLRAATNPMSTDECKDLSSFVGVLSNDKIKADKEKDQKGKKKKAKGKLNIAAGKDVDADDFEDHSHGGGGGRGWRDDDYDFM